MTFEEIYLRFRRPVWRLARRLTRSEDEALDATQEIFLRVWRGLEGFRGEAKISTWVFQIAWNYLRWYRRGQMRRLRVVTDDFDASGLAMERAEDPGPDPERRVRSAQTLQRVEGALARLSEQHRVILWLRDGEDLSYDEIAAVLSVPIGTVRSRLARARMALRRGAEA